MMDKINVVILAGDRKASIQINNDNKAFLKVNNTPCIVHTLRSFLAAEHTGNIVITGPSERLEKTLAEYGLFPDSRIKIIEQKESLIENGEAGYLASININPRENNLDNIDREKYGEIPVLITSCDIPVISTPEIDEFILKADTDKYDYLIGLCSEDSLEYYYPAEKTPGMVLNYFHLKEGNYRVNNMNIVKPLKIERLEYIEKMYEVRYQKKFFNMLKLLFRILLNGRGVLIALLKALKLHITLYCYDRGYEKIYPKFKESVKIEKVFRAISRILGTRASYIVTSYGGAALDIDHPEDRDVIEKMRVKWLEHQENLYKSFKNKEL